LGEIYDDSSNRASLEKMTNAEAGMTKLRSERLDFHHLGLPGGATLQSMGICRMALPMRM
jgi:hypothetical protein